MSTKGLGRIIARVADEMMDAAKKAHLIDEAARFESTATVKARGVFGFDKNGDIEFVAKTLAVVGGAAVPVSADVDAGEGWTSQGAGTLEVDFLVKVTLGPAG